MELVKLQYYEYVSIRGWYELIMRRNYVVNLYEESRICL